MKELPTPTLELSPVSLPRGLLHRTIQEQGKKLLEQAPVIQLEK